MNKMNEEEMQQRIEELERQAKDDYMGDIEWTYILDRLDNVKYAELKSLYKAMDDSMHTIMDDRGQVEEVDE
tara:strand:+ start:841 stop:1056 length:216 start_codon:yes stop_codon:yes gene_type:complete